MLKNCSNINIINIENLFKDLKNQDIWEILSILQ